MQCKHVLNLKINTHSSALSICPVSTPDSDKVVATSGFVGDMKTVRTFRGPGIERIVAGSLNLCHVYGSISENRGSASIKTFCLLSARQAVPLRSRRA